MKYQRLTLYSSFALVLFGILLSLWYVLALAVVLLAVTRHPILAVVLGISLDLLYGSPIGMARFFIFPFTLLALFCIAGQGFSKRYLLGKDPRTL